jgi:hypothetical protein
MPITYTHYYIYDDVPLLLVTNMNLILKLSNKTYMFRECSEERWIKVITGMFDFIYPLKQKV